ncbi:MAG: Gfo/Idh/MocA family oxidoreductase [Alphaproteobacteria bacterium]
MSTPLKVLFQGLGGVGQRHLRNLRLLEPEAEVAAVRHTGRRFEIGPDLAANHGVDIVEKYGIRLYAGITEAVRAFRPDCAVVATPTSRHGADALALVELGVPVLLEKPACASEAELDALLTATERTGVPVMVAYMLNFNPSVTRLRQMVRDGAVGRVYGVRMEGNSFLPSWHPYERYNAFYAGRRDLGGGAVLTEIHLCNLLHGLFGLPRRLWTVGGHLSPWDLDVEDTATTLMEFDGPHGPVAATIDVSLVQRPIRFAVAVRGEKGRLDWSLLDNRVVLENAADGVRESFEAPAFERNTMFVEEMRHFIACVRTGCAPDFSLKTVAGGERIALCMKQSLETGQPVTVS